MYTSNNERQNVVCMSKDEWQKSLSVYVKRWIIKSCMYIERRTTESYVYVKWWTIKKLNVYVEWWTVKS